MKIRLHRNPAASYGCLLREGETGQVDQAIGRRLVDAGIAECLDPATTAPPAKSISGVPVSPAIADAEPPAIGADQPPPTKGRKRAPPPIATYDDA